MRPGLIAHADWGTAPGKRWLAQAAWRGDHYHVAVPEPVGFVHLLPARLVAAGTPALLGVDFPLGLPEAYARQVGVTDFAALLPQLGRGRWARFFDVAATAAEIGLERPFYPLRPGGTRRHHLTDALNVTDIDALRRRCDRPRPGRRAAAPIFWTLGAQQVGKAAIAGWRELVMPALRDETLQVALWPFDGPLAELLAAPNHDLVMAHDLIVAHDLVVAHNLVVAETYPAEMVDHLALPLAQGGSKRRQADRRASGAALLAWAGAHGVTLEPALRELLADGFGPGPEYEDPFDAVLGVLGMINVVNGGRPAGPPALHQQPWLAVEGWILGQTEGDGV